MRLRHGRGIAVWLTGVFILLALGGYAQEKQEKGRKDKKSKNVPQEIPEPKRYKVEGGILQEVKVEKLADTLAREEVVTDSLPTPEDSTALLSAREQRRMRRAMLDTAERYSVIFRDSIPISRMCAISMIAPGFGQLYNQQYWKIPIAWTTLGTSLYFGIKQNKKYQSYKGEYEAMQMRNASQEELNPVQAKMIRHNTYRQLLFAGALASYVYFIGDGAVNYPGHTTSVKKATTLSTICPGAGQFYNGSYWKVPIVLGGFATMAYMIDWNNRGYKRFKLAYDLVTDKVRDVKTLSGGESFLAALSMALGMADVIRRAAGSVHLDTMFIDEGFGSLDEEARENAIRILQELAGETRLVGIISHVTELKERMDVKLVVTKNDKGSHAAWQMEG